MAKLTFTRVPERGDVILGELKTKKTVYLKADSFNSLSDIDQTKYEIRDVVFKRDGNIVKGVATTNASKTWCERYAFKLTGYTLDGADRTGVLSIRTVDAWGTAKDFTVSYNASTIEDLVSQLNAYFSANTQYTPDGGSAMDNPFKTQDWVAEIVDGYINIHFSYTDYRQASNTAKSGFAFTANTLPEIAALANMLRKNGATGGEGAISSMTKALQYFRPDNSSTTYNPSTDVTSVKRSYPICLPGYLGTSTYQSDHCAALRAIYGDGETGWLKFMESCRPVYPTDWGNMGMSPDVAARNTRIMADKRYTSQVKTNEPMCKAAYYADGLTFQTLPAHSHRLPTTQEIAELLDGVQYNVVNNRNADVLNKTLYKLGGAAISCGSYFWSAFRFSTYLAWCAYGYFGFFLNNGMCGSGVSAPVSLYYLA